MAKHFDLTVDAEVLDQPKSLLGPWYVSLFDFDGHHFLMLVNEQTRYAIPMWVADNDTIVDIYQQFLDRLADIMGSLRVSHGVARQVIDEYREGLIFTRTADRSILGTTNMLIDHCWYEFDAVVTDRARVNWFELTQKLNETPHKPLNWKNSTEGLAALLGVQPK